MDTLSEDECDGCNAKEIFGTMIVECLEHKQCEWAMNFGDGRICIYRTRVGALRSGVTLHNACQ